MSDEQDVSPFEDTQEIRTSISQFLEEIDLADNSIPKEKVKNQLLNIYSKVEKLGKN